MEHAAAVQKFKEFSETPPEGLPSPDTRIPQSPGCALPWPLSALSPTSSSSPPQQESAEYDMVLKIENLDDVLHRDKGWDLKIESAQARTSLAELSTIKIGIMGVYNRGKTTVTNMLSGRDAQVGNLRHTVGLSAVLQQNVAYLDTAGQNQPLNLTGGGRLEKQGSKAKLNFTERVAAETNTRMLGDLFMQDMVVTLSDILVVVVNQLTLEDQRYVRVLEKKVAEFEKISASQKQLIVVHNMKDVETMEDLDKLITKDIVDGFGCTEKVFYGVGKAEYRYWSSPTTVSHCVLARVGSPASKGVNAPTMALITSLMQSTFATAKTATTKKNLLQGIDDYVRTYLHNYFDKLEPKDWLEPKGCALCSQVVEKGLSKEKLSLFLNSDALDELPVIKKNAIVSEWQIIWGAQYELDYDCLVSLKELGAESNQVVVIVDLPGVFKGNPRAATREVKKDHFVHNYTWNEEGVAVVTLLVRLANKRGFGPSVEVQACRKEKELPASSIRTNDSGKRGTAYLTVPQSKFQGLDAFADARVDIGENGTLRVIMAESGFADEEAPVNPAPQPPEPTTDPPSSQPVSLPASKNTWGRRK